MTTISDVAHRPSSHLATDIPEHGVLHSLALHLGPGLLMLLFYVATVPWFMRAGFPPLFASLMSIPLILVPWMLGYLAWQGRQRTGRFDIGAAVYYRERLSPARHVLLALPVIAWGAVVFALSGSVLEPVLIERLFGWVPAWFVTPADFDSIVAMPTVPLLIFLGSLLVFAGVVAPLVEELYFRGHLLPAVRRWGMWAPVVTVALFTLYHLESPWQGPGRFLVVLPMAWVVWRTRSVRFGIVVHVLLNTISALGLTIAVLLAKTP
jgi:uncharacterized protein